MSTAICALLWKWSATATNYSERSKVKQTSPLDVATKNGKVLLNQTVRLNQTVLEMEITAIFHTALPHTPCLGHSLQKHVGAWCDIDIMVVITMDAMEKQPEDKPSMSSTSICAQRFRDSNKATWKPWVLPERVNQWGKPMARYQADLPRCKTPDDVIWLA